MPMEPASYPQSVREIINNDVTISVKLHDVTSEYNSDTKSLIASARKRDWNRFEI